MEKGETYSLEVNGEGTHHAFNYKTLDKASEAYTFLSNKFSDHRIRNQDSMHSADETVHLTISDMFIGTFPTNTKASIVPEDWFNKEIYEKMLEAARSYYEKTNETVTD